MRILQRPTKKEQQSQRQQHRYVHRCVIYCSCAPLIEEIPSMVVSHTPLLLSIRYGTLQSRAFVAVEWLQPVGVGINAMTELLRRSRPVGIGCGQAKMRSLHCSYLHNIGSGDHCQIQRTPVIPTRAPSLRARLTLQPPLDQSFLSLSSLACSSSTSGSASASPPLGSPTATARRCSA